MSTFTPEQIAALDAPLAREHVKQRDQGRSKVSYIEGWHAIAEANRIFGFDGWTRETVMSECCHEGDYEKAVYENGQRTNRTVTSFRCSYRARVRVTAMGIVREGSGHGHGFADNPGEAHESAEKEAETDAMKRALMTFGNPFGLALYDKTQAEVAPANGTVTRQKQPDIPGRAPVSVPNAKLPNPAEPTNVTAERAEYIRAWWTRGDYGINPEVIDGGLAQWDWWMLRLAETAPNIDAFIKLKVDNRPYYEAWQKTARQAADKSFCQKLVQCGARLEGAAA